MAKVMLIQEEAPPPIYVLELTELEAKAIQSLTGNVSVRGETGKAAAAVWSALHDELGWNFPALRGASGGLSFEEK